jgi:hypothetical protein
MIVAIMIVPFIVVTCATFGVTGMATVVTVTAVRTRRHCETNGHRDRERDRCEKVPLRHASSVSSVNGHSSSSSCSQRGGKLHVETRNCR